MTLAEAPPRTATCIVCGAPARSDEFNAGHRRPLQLCSDLCAVRLQESARRAIITPGGNP